MSTDDVSVLDRREIQHDRDIASLIFLTTRDGNYSTNYDNSWDISLPRLNNLKGFRLSVQSIELANVVYPINANNNKVYFKEDGGATLTATLTENSYSGSEMATHLASVLSSAVGGSGTYSGTFNLQTKKITITVTAGITNFAFTSGATDAYEELGIDSTSFAAAASSQTSDFPVSLGGSTYVDVVSNFSGHNYSSSTTGHVLTRIPLNEPFGSYIFYEPNTDDKFFVSVSQIDSVRIQLRDDKANPWLLPSNAHVSLVLKIQPTFE